jgi:Flp pilus assembly protein TadG
MRPLVRVRAVRPRAVRGTSRDRRGVAAVEAVFVLPVVIVLLMGVWEVGRLVQVDQIVSNAAREGARLAAGGSNNGTTVTVAMVQQAVRDYMTSAGMPSAAVAGATITVTNLSGNSWTDPGDAQPLDRFRVAVSIPPGAAFDSLKLGMVNSLTGVDQINLQTEWLSANDALITVDATLPL